MKLVRYSSWSVIGAIWQVIHRRGFRGTFARASVFLPIAFAGVIAQPAAPRQGVPDQLDLKTAVAFALENNFAIRQARERIREQQGIVTEVSAAGLPNVSASALYQRNSDDVAASFPAADRYWRVNLTAAQTLFAGGGVRSSIRAADLAREAAILDLQAVINDALLSVRVGFYNVLLAREQINVQEQNLALLQSQLRNAINRYESGTTSGFERLRAEVAVANAQAPLIRARNDFRLAVEELRQALGFTNNQPESLRKVPEFIGTLMFEPMTFDLQAAFDAAHANRPDLQRLSKLTASREESVKTARSGYYPNLAFVGGWELRKGATNRVGDSNDGFLIGLQSQWNIFDGRATAGRVAQARSRLEQTRLAEDEANLAVEVEVRAAYSSFLEASELAEAAQKTVGQAEEAVRLATARYEAGTATQLDQLQTQVELTTARTNQVQANYGYNVAVARLRKAMGVPDVFYGESR